MKRGLSKFYKSINILRTRRFIDKFFKKHPEYEDLGSKYIRKLGADFFQVAGDLLVEQPNGIVLDGIGYFSNTVFDKRMVVRGRETKINIITKGMIYKSYLFPSIFNTAYLKWWSFSICRKRKKQMNEKIKNGMKYQCHYSLLQKQKNNGRSYFLRSIYK